jgi:hypothetical protein
LKGADGTPSKHLHSEAEDGSAGAHVSLYCHSILGQGGEF